MSDRCPGRIVILSGNHLCHNPRVIKEALTFASAGHDVTVLGGFIDTDLKERDLKLLDKLPFHFSPVIDMTLGPTRNLVPRVRTKLGMLAHKAAMLENRWQLGYAYPYLRKAAFNEKADVYIAHSEQALAVAADLLHAGYRVALDMEDWYSEDLLPEARRNRPTKLLASLEQVLLRNAIFSSAPSHAMSAALAAHYKCPSPAVIYNAFPWKDRESIDGLIKDRKNQKRPSIVWFSQTIGKGRGLEDLLNSLRYVVYDAEVHLRGKVGIDSLARLHECIPENWRDRVFIHDLIPGEELLSRIAEHDIGFAGESANCPSRDLTVTNKLLLYLLGGLAVVASDTSGQREIAAQARIAVHLYQAGKPIALARELNLLLGTHERLRLAKAGALEVAEKIFCWENQERVLKNQKFPKLNTRKA